MPAAEANLVLLRSGPGDKTSAEALASALESVVFPAPEAITIERVGESDDWVVEAIFDSASTPAVRQSLAAAGIADALTEVSLPEVDWVALTLAGLPPVRAGRFLVHGSHDRDQRHRGAVPIEIDAATAFGTGHHGTTLGCLMALDWLMKQRRPRRILDVGSGTGVLAIAGSLAAKSRSVAVDIDPEAARVTRANARLNGAMVEVYCSATPARREIASQGPYELIFANILARRLVALSPSLIGLLATDGTLVLSGLQAAQERWVFAAYRDRGLRLRRRFLIEGWVSLVLGKG